MAESLSILEILNDYNIVKNKLGKISFDQTCGVRVRSKALWHEFGRSSKYFLNLDKKNFENKCAASLTKNDESIETDPGEILEEERRYYKKFIFLAKPSCQ